MAYLAIRLLLLLLFALMLWILNKLFIKNRKKIKIPIIILMIIGYLLLALTPFENSFMGFSSVTDSFYYSFIGCKIRNIVNENGCAVITYEKQINDHRWALYMEKGSKWNICNPYITTGYKSINRGMNSVNVAYFNSKKKVYVEIESIIFNGEQDTVNQVKDSRESNFKSYSLQFYGGYDKCYYAFVNAPLSNYYLMVNGEKITIG